MTLRLPLLALLLAGSAAAQAPSPAPGRAAPDPLLAEWTGPYGGVPPFDRVRVEDFEPAFDAAMAQNLAEIQRIAVDPAPPTFENTIEALERSGRGLDRVNRIYSVWSSNLSTPAFQAARRVIGPKLAAHSDRLLQDEALFRRIEGVYLSPDSARLTPEQRRLRWQYYTNYVRAGARLGVEGKARVAEINQRLAGLFARFSENLLYDENNYPLVLEAPAELAGLPQGVRDAAAQAAASRGMAGKWVIENKGASVAPFLAYSARRDLRERAWRSFTNRGDMGGEHDNNRIVSEILALRAERAKLRGYPTHAHFKVEAAVAATPERAMALMEALLPPALEKAKQEVADAAAAALAEDGLAAIEPWDYAFYAEKVRKARYDLDQEQLTPYLQLDRIREGMFWVAGELFGLDFGPLTGVPVFHPDVSVWRVTDRATGRDVGLLYFDPFARPGKNPGAWTFTYRKEERFDRPATPISAVNTNISKGKPGEPVLITWGNAVTLFHEFGHALNTFASNTAYPSLSGPVPQRDYVEFPSQLLEHWLRTPEVLQRFAIHYRTGEPMPRELLDRLERAQGFNQGVSTTRLLASALLDMKLHLAGDTPIDPDAYERQALAELGIPPEVGMAHRLPHFYHAFESDNYSAGYYGYLWADLLTADAYEAFTEAGGPYDPAVAQRLRDYVFSVGNTIDPAEGYRKFRGRDPTIDALLRKRGLTP
jgi:peptidyl-dipeptidase Dcp